jgi:hypothetical protein
VYMWEMRGSENKNTTVSSSSVVNQSTLTAKGKAVVNGSTCMRAVSMRAGHETCLRELSVRYEARMQERRNNARSVRI